MAVRIRAMRAEEAADCETILRSLPGWFGIETAIVGYARDLVEMETWVAERDGAVVGFLTLRTHGPRSAEVQVMAVACEEQGRGCGRRLVRRAERELRARSVDYLQVKTLGPSRPDAGYERTRAFYESVGFVPLEEHGLWGEGNPCLVMVKHLPCGQAGDEGELSLGTDGRRGREGG